MKNIFLTIAVGLGTLLGFPGGRDIAFSQEESGKLYTFKVNDIDNKAFDMNKLKGKVVLVVNVASKCGFTPQYKGLEEIYEKYKDKGFEIVAFPCNQFASQEPGTADEIKEFCSVNYNVTFPLMAKIDVNGDNAIPLYKYLTNLGGQDHPIKWNFTKFLFDRNGTPIGRYESRTKPENIAPDIEKALAKQ